MYKILCKFPTRTRPQLFLKTLGEYISKASNNSFIQYLISYDSDDETMTPEVIKQAESLHENVKLIQGTSNNKIEACNRDIEKADDWDILILISDDMECKADGWDERLRNDMKVNYPDTDGCYGIMTERKALFQHFQLLEESILTDSITSTTLLINLFSAITNTPKLQQAKEK
jgi:hypothetical protein